MKSLFFISVLSSIFCAAAFAQTNETSPCPTIEITGPVGVIPSGETAIFTVSVGENYSDTAKYEWSVSAGVIIEGQNSPVVKIATTPEMDGAEITASVKVNNLPENCANAFSERAVVESVRCGLLVELDEYGKLPFRDEKARLSVVASQLTAQPTFAALFIIKFTEQETSPSIKARVARISKVLTESFGIPKDKLLFVYAQGEDQSTRIYVLPPDAVNSFPGGEKSLEELRPSGTSSKKPSPRTKTSRK